MLDFKWTGINEIEMCAEFPEKMYGATHIISTAGIKKRTSLPSLE
ncbi:hypothetical protein WCP94_000184 (plasmid) [Bilophila wadsworthia]